MLIKSNIPLTDDNRCEFLASPNGILGQSAEGLRKALMEGYDDSIHIIEYSDLINNPKETIDKIYEFLGEEPFDHDFNNIENVNRENDAQIYGIADMHEVRSKVKSISTNPSEILSENILQKCKNTEFWRVIQTNEEDTESKFIGSNI
jgi:sulfotransferase